FGAVLRRLVVSPLGERPLRTFEPEPRTVALGGELPAGRQESLVPRPIDPVVVRSRHHFDGPSLVRGELRPAFRLDLAAHGALGGGDRNDLAFFQGMAFQPADPG